MKPNRREFLKGLVAAGAVRVVPIAALAYTPLTLWADGIHDDTEALQSFLDGKPVYIPDGGNYARVEGKKLVIEGGRFLISKTLEVGHKGEVCFYGNVFDFCGDAPRAGDALLRIMSPQNA